MRRPDDAGLLVDMFIACQDIQQVVAGKTYDDYVEDPLVHLAVVRLIEIIGEAASKLSADFVAANSHIPWREMIGMRNRLIHNYREINLFLVWQTVEEDVPALIDQIRPLLPPIDPEGSVE